VPSCSTRCEVTSSPQASWSAPTGAPEAIEPLALEINAAVRRQLAGEPFADSDRDLPWDVHKTGSAAIECAFVAAGLLRVAWFARPNIRDVAGGVPLVANNAGTMWGA
jgi:myo-inositol-1(or 4)-monophosphatase